MEAAENCIHPYLMLLLLISANFNLALREIKMNKIQRISTWVTYSKVLENRISVELPKEFDAQEVQIIIIPKTETAYSNKDEWKKDFLSISQWNISEDDIRMESWQIQEF